MPRRYMSIWFQYLTPDWMVRRQPALAGKPFVTAQPEHGRMIIREVSKAAHAKGITPNMVVADAKAILPTLQVSDYEADRATKLLAALAEWMIRFTPIVAVDLPNGLIMDISGCSHLWGGEEKYLNEIHTRLATLGYNISLSIADTVGAAHAVARHGKGCMIVEEGKQLQAIMALPPVALRINDLIVQKLFKLGMYKISSFIDIPPRALRRRFGDVLLQRLHQAVGYEYEYIEGVRPDEPYLERLPCLEPIRTAEGIEIAVERLLEMLCKRLEAESKGLRKCVLKGYRIDGNVQSVEIGTSRATRNPIHISRLLKLKLATIEPALGIELFTMDACITEDLTAEQEMLWGKATARNDALLGELLDRFAGKVGIEAIRRYLPQAHHWPERSIKPALSLKDKADIAWDTEIQRPISLLTKPEPIEVMVQIPDYPPVLFHYKKQVHRIRRADGPERIEQEWWIEQGLYRDYYCVEDEEGRRYWLYRSGSYDSSNPQWFLHGFFA